MEMVLSTAATPRGSPWQDDIHFSIAVNLKDEWAPVKVTILFLFY